MPKLFGVRGLLSFSLTLISRVSVADFEAARPWEIAVANVINREPNTSPTPH